MSYKHHHAKRKPFSPPKAFARGDYGGSDFVEKIQNSEVLAIGGNTEPQDPTSNKYFGLHYYLPEKRDIPYKTEYIDTSALSNKEASNFRGYEIIPTASDLREKAPRTNVWGLDQAYMFNSLWGSYVFPCHKATQMITPDELTAQGLVAGDKFTRLKQRVWGDFLNDEERLPKGIRIRMFHLNTEISDPTDATLTAFETQMAEMRMPDTKDPYRAVIVYQDKTTTKFPPLLDAFNKTKTAFDQILSDNNITDYYTNNDKYLSDYRGDFRLRLSQQNKGRSWDLPKGRPIGGGAARLHSEEYPHIGSGMTGLSSGEGYEVCVDFGTGDAPDADCHDDFFDSAEQESSFTWNGEDPVVVEVSSYYNDQNFEPIFLLDLLDKNVNNRDLQVRTDFRGRDPFGGSLASFKTQPHVFQKPSQGGQTYAAVENYDTYNFGVRHNEGDFIDAIEQFSNLFYLTNEDSLALVLTKENIQGVGGFADLSSFAYHRMDPDTGASRFIMAEHHSVLTTDIEDFHNTVNGYQLRPQLRTQDSLYYKFHDTTYDEYTNTKSGEERRNNELSGWIHAGVLRDNQKIRNFQEVVDSNEDPTDGRSELQVRDGIQNVTGAIRLECT